MKYYCSLALLLLLSSSAQAVQINQKNHEANRNLNKYKPPTTDDYVNEKILSDRKLDAQEKAERNEKKFQAAQEDKAVKKFEQMQQEFKEFSRTIDQDHFDKGMELKGQLAKGGIIPEENLNIKRLVNTSELFQKQFKFPSISKNQYTQDKLDELEIAEKNLNNNPDNEKLLEKFITVTNNVKKEFKQKFENNWTDPADDSVQNSTNVQEEVDEIES